MFKWLSCVALILMSINLLAETNAPGDAVRDPTTPLGHVVSSAVNAEAVVLELNSVLISSRRKIAIINGDTLREGQQLPGSNITIQHILPQKVLLKQGDKIWALTLSPDVVKRH